MKSNLDFTHQSLTELNRFDISHYPPLKAQRLIASL